ncbi:MAG TPA: ribosome small subunit-dependent GTPase A [Anaerolineae bacterium]|nr:ribosome small subunit-dependent GTPase A [Anaerolineae bacterium]HQH38869.1 ribosome small subunit-dependent GTPase A [Anaerolineae bacterium]
MNSGCSGAIFRGGGYIQEGLVIKAQSGFYTLLTETGDRVVARLRGRLKKEHSESSIVAVGDRVTWQTLDDGSVTIEAVHERTRALARLKPLSSGRGTRRWDRQGYLREKEQVIIANPDQVVFVIACASPDPHLKMLDRLLVGAERQDIPALICANKTDLVGLEKANALFGIYERIGYNVVYTSAVTGEGIDMLRTYLKAKTSALIGPSGVGKTSLLNALEPGLGKRVMAVNDITGKGRHTTTVAEMVPLAVGGWVADTPGLRALALFDLDPEEIDAYFPDIAPYVPHCAFSDCTHTIEPGCAVLHAVEIGAVDAHRHESYVRLYQEHRKLADMYWWGIDEEK